MSMKSCLIPGTAAVLALSVPLTPAPAFACGGKLDLPCPEYRMPTTSPLYKPDFGSGSNSHSLPNPSPTIVTPHDSRGKTVYGPGIQYKF